MFGYTHDAWNRLTEVKIDAAVLGQYEYNALHWRSVKRSRTPGAGSLDEMRLMYYSANWQLLEERIDRSWTSGFTEDERAQTFWGKRYIDDAVGGGVIRRSGQRPGLHHTRRGSTADPSSRLGGGEVGRGRGAGRGRRR